MTFAAACEHMTNYTTAHESRARGSVGKIRLSYPDNHIEVDNRLSWMLGRLHKRYGHEPFFVHLKRDREAVARSFLSRMGNKGGIIHTYATSVIINGPQDISSCRDYVETVTANIEMFLQDKRYMEVNLEAVKSDFAIFWKRIGAEGDLKAALKAWDVVRNRTKGKR
jgi:hypothetical protein